MNAFDQSWLLPPSERVAQRGPRDLIPPPWRMFWLPLCMALTRLLIRAVIPQAPTVQSGGSVTPEQCGDKPAARHPGQADAVQIVPVPQPCNIQVPRRE